jgi:hypothetical protein
MFGHDILRAAPVPRGAGGNPKAFSAAPEDGRNVALEITKVPAVDLKDNCCSAKSGTTLFATAPTRKVG